MYVLNKQGIHYQEGFLHQNWAGIKSEKALSARPHLQQNWLPMVSLRLLPIIVLMLRIMVVTPSALEFYGTVLSDQSKRRRLCQYWCSCLDYGGIKWWNKVHWVLSDQSKKRKTFEVAGCAKKSTVARGSSQDFVAMSFIAVFSHKRGRCIWPERPFLISVA